MGLPAGVFNQTYAEQMASVRTKTQWVWLGVLLLALVVFPHIVARSMVSLAIMAAIWVVAALGLNILLGYCGQISVAQSAFMAVGGYTAAILETKLGLSFWQALPLAGLSAGLVGLAFGIPSLRIKGLYLALVTLAAQIVIIWVILRWYGLTGGPKPVIVSAPELGPLSFDQPRTYYYLAVFLAALATYLANCLVRSRIGRAFTAIRDGELAAQAMGVDVFRHKLFAFFLGCAFAGVAGSLFVHHIGVASTEHFTLWQSIWLVGMIMIGGMGSISGTIMGVLFVVILQELTSYMSAWLASAAPMFAQGAGAGVPAMFFGLVIILFLIYEPRGLAHRWHLLKTYYRIWPFAWQERS